MNPMPNVHPILAAALAPFLGQLAPRRVCSECAEWTGSLALDRCEEHQELFLEYGASECANITTQAATPVAGQP